MVDIYTLTPGAAPLLISFPHSGTHIPEVLAARMTDAALQRADVDWHLPRLYEAFARALGASTLVAHHARHVIDLNRPPEDCRSTPFARSRYTGRAGPPMRPRPTNAASATGGRITTPCAPNSNACAPATAWRCCGTRIRSPA